MSHEICPLGPHLVKLASSSKGRFEMKNQISAPGSSTGFDGNERRRHRAYVTRNSEYHFRGNVCVGVRNRQSGSWVESHIALNHLLGGGVRLQDGEAVLDMDGPQVGGALFFVCGKKEMVTSRLCSVERPSKEAVAQYPE